MPAVNVEGLGPGLMKALDLIKNGYGTSAEKLSQLGQTFQELGARSPGYFATSKELPTGLEPGDALRMLNAKHGLGQRSGLSMSSNLDTASVLGPHGVEMAPINSLGRLSNTPAGSYLKQNGGQLDPETLLHYIDTSNVPAGSGIAKKLYPALYDYILSRPSAANLADVLTDNNQVRRSGNMVGSLEKYGDPAANKLLVGHDQLNVSADRLPTGAPDLAGQYLHLPTDAKIGVLNALNAAHTGARATESFGRLGKMVNNMDLADPGAPIPSRINDLAAQARALGIDLSGRYSPSTDVGPTHYQDVAGLLRGINHLTNNAQSVGVDSLRRAAIVNDSLAHGLQASDLSGQPWLTQGLARKTGGSIPELGALTKCACGH